MGVAHYHSRTIAHRDLKPENILVDMNCPDYSTKIIDFGFATRSREKLNIFCGTPAYMSPEICKKEKYDGRATDIWACGIILYTMLFGFQPFKASSEQELYRRIQKGQFKFPHVQAETLKFENYGDIEQASTIKALITAILQQKEEKRISAAEMLEQYTEWLN